ncbi:hypothetical protein TCAL_06397 [Tigriopus californicus]|uniref:Uncharacterized protein n=1 Tax=Tigriopus californicus TaxID=6832 RepID=A0A553PB55_TIGCA|nr:hypothetical protein TCAL_06397 [Tigriopus californicus]
MLPKTMDKNPNSASHADLLAWKKRLLGEISHQKRLNRQWEDLAILEWQNQIKRLDLSQNDGEGQQLLAQLSQVFGSRMGRGLAQQQSLERTLSLHEWQIDEYKSKINSISDDGTVSTEWRVSFRIQLYPSVILAFKYDGISKDPAGEMPRMEELQIAFPSPTDDPRLVIQGEIEPLIDYCERLIDLSVALNALKMYLNLSTSRSQVVQGKTEELDNITVSVEDQFLEIALISGNHVHLCTLKWGLVFKESHLAFEDTYHVTFTAKGKVAAVGCNFSQELINVGICDDWSATYCFQNLCQMTAIDI